MRQYVYKRDVIEGALSQFTDAEVRTVENDDSESHHVVLKQEGMFLAGVSEQFLRETTPTPNFYSTELRISSALSAFLNEARYKTSEEK